MIEELNHQCEDFIIKGQESFMAQNPALFVDSTKCKKTTAMFAVAMFVMGEKDTICPSFIDLVKEVTAAIEVPRITVLQASPSTKIASVFKFRRAPMIFIDWIKEQITIVIRKVIDTMKKPQSDQDTCSQLLIFLYAVHDDITFLAKRLKPIFAAWVNKKSKTETATWWAWIDDVAKVRIDEDRSFRDILQDNFATHMLYHNPIRTSFQNFLSARFAEYDAYEAQNQQCKSNINKMMSNHRYAPPLYNAPRFARKKRTFSKSAKAVTKPKPPTVRTNPPNNWVAKHNKAQSNYQKQRQNEFNATDLGKSILRMQEIMKALGQNYNKEHKFCAKYNADIVECPQNCTFKHKCPICQLPHMLASCPKWMVAKGDDEEGP